MRSAKRRCLPLFFRISWKSLLYASLVGLASASAAIAAPAVGETVFETGETRARRNKGQVRFQSSDAPCASASAHSHLSGAIL
jgi:hypothetical protein